MARAYIGTSGWSYPSWGDFYGETPAKRRLEYCAERFTGLEINASHYRLQSPETYRDWRQRVPEDFRFALKAHRFLTHRKRLANLDDHLPISRDRTRALGPKLAVVLWQLPARFRADHARLRTFARMLSRRWTRVRHAIELRHPSWFEDDTAALLAEHELAVCLSDAPDFPLWDRVTTDLVYVRLHGHTRKYASSYSRRSLTRWAERTNEWLAEDREVHVYFDNDAEGAAPRNAIALLELVRAG
jgi:uncharacterized protein YecE (DUF72 family)